MDRILRDAGGVLTLRNYDANGDLADVDGANAPSGASQVTDSAGTVVAGFTFARTGTGVYTCTLPANLEVLDRYAISWAWANGQSRASEFELVGGFLFTIPDVRAFDPALADETTYPDARIIQARGHVEDVFEHQRTTGMAFRPRGRRVDVDGTGTRGLFLPDTHLRLVRAVTMDGTAFTSGELADVAVYPHGEIVRATLGTFTAGIRNVQVLYEFGEGAVPGDVWQAALKLARYALAPGPMDGDGRATAQFNEFGGFRLTIAGRDGPTGLPDVDAVLDRYRAAPAMGFA